jgi:L-cystine uptake protein TcyP (sodium:dicarboxylate symporter family)
VGQLARQALRAEVSEALTGGRTMATISILIIAVFVGFALWHLLTPRF